MLFVEAFSSKRMSVGVGDELCSLFTSKSIITMAVGEGVKLSFAFPAIKWEAEGDELFLIFVAFNVICLIAVFVALEYQIAYWKWAIPSQTHC